MIKKLLHEITPPILWRAITKFRKTKWSNTNKFEYGMEQPQEFYDHTYHQSEHWKNHYTESHYYPLWTVVADRIRHVKPKRILDIGCGPGQFACLVRDMGISEYVGLDFSMARIKKAREVCPEYEFVVADVFKDQLITTDEYDVVLLMEFLEHVERDIEILEKIRPGTIILGTVPSYPSAGHVRHFDSVKDVELRYNHVIKELSITPVLARKDGTTYYLIQGKR